mgnify:CR=1 FL=1
MARAPIDAFRGSITALATPFIDGKIDEAAYRRLIGWQIEAGTHAMVPAGTTGESPTLSHDEHRRVVDLCLEVADGRVPVIAGCGSNNTAESLGLIRHADEAGADAALVVCPYYNKPTQEGLMAHYMALADASDLPIFIYNVPSRTVIAMNVDTMAKLNDAVPSIIGVKDATGDAARISAQRLACGPDFIQLSGNDDIALAVLALGGHGCISVTANCAPALCAQMQNAGLAGDFDRARACQDKLYPLHHALFVDPNPTPVKYALSRLGLCAPDCRLPLVAVSASARQAVDHALAHAGLI